MKSVKRYFKLAINFYKSVYFWSLGVIFADDDYLRIRTTGLEYMYHLYSIVFDFEYLDQG